MRSRSMVAYLLVAAAAAACGNTPAATPTQPPPTPSPVTPTVAPTASPTAPPATQSSSADLQPILAAAEATIARGAASIEQSVEFDGNSQIPDGTTIEIVGVTSFRQPTQMAANGDFSALGIGEFEMIVDDQHIYLRGMVVETLTGPGKWLLVDLASDDPRAAGFKGLATGQNDASLLLYFLYGAKPPVTALPPATIDGQPTQHFSMRVDADAAVAAAPAAARSRLEANVAALRTSGVQTSLRAEVWVGADGLIHQVQYTYAMGAAAGGGTMTTACQFSRIGEPLDLGIPADKDVVNLEDA